jgi:hypothetical protein
MLYLINAQAQRLVTVIQGRAAKSRGRHGSVCARERSSRRVKVRQASQLVRSGLKRTQTTAVCRTN